jgi:outer membrane protein assembly factor BamD (BamD/ComL family)
MTKIKVSRKELLKKPDEFITKSAKAIIFARDHSSKLKLIGIIIVALAVIYVSATTYKGYVNKKGQEAFNTAYYSITKKGSTGIDSEDLTESENLFRKVNDNYGLSKASLLALPELAYIKVMEKEYDAAIDLYKEFQDKISEDDPYQALTNLALAGCYEAKGETENAINTLEQITSSQDDFFKEQAMISLARVYTAADLEDKSQAVLIDFVKKYPESQFLELAKARIR